MFITMVEYRHKYLNTQPVVCRGEGANGATAPGINRVKLHFIKLLKIYAFSYRKSANKCCVDLIGSCLVGHGETMIGRKSSAASAFVLKLLFTKFRLVCYVLYKKKHAIIFDFVMFVRARRNAVSCNPKHRVTIFVKVKIGTTDGHFGRGQNFGLFNYLYNKIGTLKLTCRLVSAGNRRGFKKKRNRDDLQKKKKKVNTCLAAHFVPLLGRKLHKSCIQTGFDLFFFLEITPKVIVSCLTSNKV